MVYKLLFHKRKYSIFVIITEELLTFLAGSEPHSDQSDRSIGARKPFPTNGYSPFRKYGVRRSERPSKGRYIGVRGVEIASFIWSWRPIYGA